jgi:putative phosphoesterase
MKRIGLLSDTHGFWDSRFEEYFSDCDEIWHAGDIGDIELAERFESIKPFRAVHGNIDDFRVRAAFPEKLRFEIEGVDVLMTHIGGYPGKYDPRVSRILSTAPPKIFICGHSHILRVIYDKRYSFLNINPGAAGKHGFHKVRTIMRLSFDDGRITDAEVIELKDGRQP